MNTVEAHPERSRIEYDLARGVPIRVVAVKYGLSRSMIGRAHLKLPPQLKAAAHIGAIISEEELERLRVEESKGLLQNLAMQRARLLLAQDAAMEGKSGKARLSVAQISAQIHKNIELTGRYLGEFAQHSVQTKINVLIQPEYLELRHKITRALAPYPEARQAVIEALHLIEDRAARQTAPSQPARPLQALLEATPTEASPDV